MIADENWLNRFPADRAAARGGGVGPRISATSAAIVDIGASSPPGGNVLQRDDLCDGSYGVDAGLISSFQLTSDGGHGDRQGMSTTNSPGQ